MKDLGFEKDSFTALKKKKYLEASDLNDLQVCPTPPHLLHLGTTLLP